MAEQQLVQAEKNHLEVGQLIFVRGRKAVVVDVDFPNVYWRFYGDEAVKHRSYFVNPKIFQVPVGTPLRSGRKNTNTSVIDFTDSDDDDHPSRGVPPPVSPSDFSEAVDFSQAPEFAANFGDADASSNTSPNSAAAVNAALDAFADKPNTSNNDFASSSSSAQDGVVVLSSKPPAAQVSENLTTEKPHEESNNSEEAGIGKYPDPKTAKKNVMLAFAVRKPKLSVRDQHGPDPFSKALHAISPDLTQGVIVEKSDNIILKSQTKLANLNIVDCTGIEVDIPGSVSAVELLRCKDITITCRNFATTFQVERSERILFRFPNDSKDVKLVSVGCPQVKALTFDPVPDADDSKFFINDETSKSLDLDAKLTELGLLGEEGTPQIEILTRWNSVTKEFEVQALQRDNREMPINL
eukprot:TRINITY_DN4162_c0_g1_i2.p1 TRINITY_DN4162_c0_g1~~TRINITY_DN4162_c0_g1_i2.p1  ORF type:complete len:418 (-),score=125.50 TRINITY_DN4162_c0_g1_i2:106-1335(-)